jgi:hypothetical protein
VSFLSLQISSVLSHNTGLAFTRDIHKSVSNSKSHIFTTGRLLFQFSADTAVELFLGYSRLKPGVFERVYMRHVHHCWLIYQPATGHSSGWIQVLPGSRPAKRPGCVNETMLSCIPLLCPAISGTCRPGENRNVWTRLCSFRLRGHRDRRSYIISKIIP